MKPNLCLAFPPVDLMSLMFSGVTDLWLDGDCPVTNDVMYYWEIQSSKINPDFLRRKEHFILEQSLAFLWDSPLWSVFLELNFLWSFLPTPSDLSVSKLRERDREVAH